MPTDSELLRQYVAEGSEAAFTEIVRCHAGLVYSAALRLAGDEAHLAEDITQEVFILLIRKAPRLLGYETLAGWLHITTRFVALRTLRARRSRAIREQEAVAMQTNTARETEWKQLRPLLDEAVARLDDCDRDAVLLRYFEGRSHREVGAALGVNEDAARVRTDRAVEKLRRYFARSGVVTSAMLLTEALTVNSAQATPAGLAGKVSAASLAHAKGLGLGHAFLKAFFMTTKTKIAVVTAGLVAVIAAVPLQIQYQANVRLQTELVAAQKRETALQAGQHKMETQLASQPLQLRENEPAPMAAAQPIGSERAGPVGARAGGAADPLATLEPNLNAAFDKDPAATMAAVAAFYAKVSAANGLTQRLDAASLKDAASKPAVASTMSDPATAAVSAMNMPAGRERNLAIVAAAQAWVQQDPGAASEWMVSVVDTLPQDDKTKEHVIEALLPAAINEDPKTAFAWANTIGDDMVRANRISDVVKVWAKTDPAGAAQAVQSANLTDETRGNLLLKIQAITSPPSN